MDLRDNFFLSSFLSFKFITIFLILILVVHIPICAGNDENNITSMQHKNCSRSFNCGDLKNISYPFWGNGRPSYCGIPGYKLDCVGGFPEIQILVKRYRVLRIDQSKTIMRITKKDFIDDLYCPSGFDNTTLDLSLFNYAQGVRNLTLYYNKNSSSSCRNHSIVIPIMNTATARLRSSPANLSDVVKEGFDVNYIAIGNSITSCNECTKSGGECGYDNSTRNGSLVTQSITCFCPNGTRPNQTHCGAGGRGNLRKKIIIVATTTVAGIIIITLLLLILIRYSRNKSSSNDDSVATLSKKNETNKKDNQKVEAFIKSYGALAPRRFRYTEIKKMTNTFKEKLGQGGYGAVFRGQLPDGRLVAVKVLFSNSQKSHSGEEFINEVASISRTCHVNVVALLGFCFQKNKKALVYEFMPNGSLDKFIYGGGGENQLAAEPEHTLGWETLYQIAVGIARGLEYLHRGCSTRILHFDIKPHNILLDEDFCPKISDFGLAKLCPGKESKISMLGTRGTAGYIAPEVFSRNFGGVSHKSDVYSYGMMVLEMVGQRKNIDVNVGIDHSSQLYFPHWIYDQLGKQEGLGLQGIMTEEREEATRKMIIVGLWCIQTNPSTRPSMSKVLEMLEGSVEALQIPPKPFLSSPPRSPRPPTSPPTSSSAISIS